jgi:hypothetical protein
MTAGKLCHSLTTHGYSMSLTQNSCVLAQISADIKGRIYKIVTQKNILYFGNKIY